MLEWKDTEPNKMNWERAKKLENDGWRLPTRGELIDAYDNKIEGFKLERYWSSTFIPKWDPDVYLFSFKTGDIFMDHKVFFECYVRLCKDI